jgi:uncharacterized membrane protein YadS
VGAENMQALRSSVSAAAALAPRIALSAIVAAIGYVTAPYVARFVPIPNMVIALVVGIALNPLAARPAVQPGMQFCVKTLLRWAVALLGRVFVAVLAEQRHTADAVFGAAMPP